MGKGRGWHGEPGRHADAARGVKTARGRMPIVDATIYDEIDKRRKRKGRKASWANFRKILRSLEDANLLPPWQWALKDYYEDYLDSGLSVKAYILNLKEQLRLGPNGDAVAARGYKTRLARELHRDGFGSVNEVFQRLERKDKELRQRWDQDKRFALGLVYSGGVGGTGHERKKWFASRRWVDLSDDAQFLLLQEFAYGDK